MPYIDFKLVKKLVSMEELLARFNVKLRIVGGDKLKGKCPLPGHGTTKSESFSVTRGKNLWKCFDTNCDCGGNVLDFVMQMENCSLAEAAVKIVEWYGPVGPAGQKEKAPAHGKGPDVPSEHHQEQVKDKPVAPVVKGYMKEVEDWWAGLIERGDQEEDADYWKLVLNGVNLCPHGPPSNS